MRMKYGKQKREVIEEFFKDWNKDIDSLLDQEDAWLYLDTFLFHSLHHHFSKKIYGRIMCSIKKEFVN